MLKDGSKYIGEWLHDQQHGHGTYTWQDGSEYIGEWLLGEQNGLGVYTDVNGDIFEGSWENNQFELEEDNPNINKSNEPELGEKVGKEDSSRELAELINLHPEVLGTA